MAQKEDVMTFLKWILDNYLIKNLAACMRIGGYGVSCTTKLWVVAFTPKVVKTLTMWDMSLCLFLF